MLSLWLNIVVVSIPFNISLCMYVDIIPFNKDDTLWYCCCLFKSHINISIHFARVNAVVFCVWRRWINCSIGVLGLKIKFIISLIIFCRVWSTRAVSSSSYFDFVRTEDDVLCVREFSRWSEDSRSMLVMLVMYDEEGSKLRRDFNRISLGIKVCIMSI